MRVCRANLHFYKQVLFINVYLCKYFCISMKFSCKKIKLEEARKRKESSHVTTKWFRLVGDEKFFFTVIRSP